MHLDRLFVCVLLGLDITLPFSIACPLPPLEQQPNPSPAGNTLCANSVFFSPRGPPQPPTPPPQKFRASTLSAPKSAPNSSVVPLLHRHARPFSGTRHGAFWRTRDVALAIVRNDPQLSAFSVTGPPPNNCFVRIGTFPSFGFSQAKPLSPPASTAEAPPILDSATRVCFPQNLPLRASVLVHFPHTPESYSFLLLREKNLIFQ